MKSLKQVMKTGLKKFVSTDAERGDVQMPVNVRDNLKAWDKTHSWSKDGDEWDGQAALCGVPYPAWKDSLVRHLLTPNITKQSHVLEIAPGHGRWTEYLANLAGHVTIVDLSANCLDFCRSRFHAHRNIDYVLTTGDRLPLYAEDRIDFVWSYDSFVHMDRDVIHGYLREIRRVLKPGGTALIHHANVEKLAGHQQNEAPGWRSAMNADLMAQLARDAGLSVPSQFVYWDQEKKIGIPRFNDRFTQLKR